jgi:hypothetical protein
MLPYVLRVPDRGAAREHCSAQPGAMRKWLRSAT